MARVCSWSKIHSRLTPDVSRTRRPYFRRAFDFEDVTVGIEEVELGKLAGAVAPGHGSRRVILIKFSSAPERALSCLLATSLSHYACGNPPSCFQASHAIHKRLGGISGELEDLLGSVGEITANRELCDTMH